MKKINLTQGKHALVDDENFDWLNQWKWSISHTYASRTMYKPSKKSIRMHQLVLKVKKGQIIDHINHNTLDNRWENLRVCSAKENQYNSSIRKTNKTGFKGVSIHSSGKYEARIGVNGRKLHLGLFLKAKDAAKVYSQAVLKYHAKFAYQN